MRTLVALAALALLAACGKQGELMPKPPPGQVAHVDPTRPLPSALLVPPPQGRPQRVDDPLSKSEARRDDHFSLPPQ